jgi:hypothetical protein
MIFASHAYADSYDKFNSDGEDYSHFNNSEDDKYRDWKNVLGLLAAKGVNTNSIDWDAVAASCANIQNKTSGNAYNKCKYKNTINYVKYQKDRVYCDAESHQKYFDYINQGNGGTTINNFVDSNNYTVNYKATLNNQEIKKFKDSAYTICMRDAKWNNASSWVARKNYMGKHYKNHR